MADDTELKGQLASDPPPVGGDTTDQDIMANVLFSVALGTIIFAVFMAIRTKIKGLYSANFNAPEKGKRRLNFKHEEGALGWLRTVASASDQDVLALVGLDGFLFQQLLRLVFWTLVLVALPLGIVLVPLYALSGPSEQKVYSSYYRLSILHCSEGLLWIPVLAAYLCAVLVFYLLYSFYRNYARLRQGYLLDPSAFTSVPALLKLERTMGSLERARQVLSLHTRTVLISGISWKYARKDLDALFRKTGAIAPPEKVAFLSQAGRDVVGLASARNKTVQQLEGALQAFLSRAVERCVKGGVKADRAERDAFIVELGRDRQPLAVRLGLLGKLRRPDFFPELRPTHPIETLTGVVEVDAIEFHYNEMMRLEGELDLQLRQYKDRDSQGLETATVVEKDDDPVESDPEEDAGAEKKAFRDKATVISLRKIGWVRHNLKDLALLTSSKGQQAIVTTPTPEAAAALVQALLSRRSFSLQARQAPAAQDINWEAVQLSPARRTARYWRAALALAGVYLLFLPIVGLITSLCSVDSLLSKAPGSVSDWFEEHSRAKSMLQGIIGPGIMNVAFGLAPNLLRAILLLQARDSWTANEKALVSSYSWFLFIQAFFVIVAAGALLDVLRESAQGKFGSVLRALQTTLPTRSPLLLNMLLQQAILGTAKGFLNIGRLIAYLLKGSAGDRATPRERQQKTKTFSMDQGKDLAKGLVFGAQVTLAFMFLSPVNVMAGALLFLLAQPLARYTAIYTSSVRVESGGRYVAPVVKQLLLGLEVAVVFLLLHVALRGAWLALAIGLPLVALPLVMSRILARAFGKRSRHVPQTQEDLLAVQSLIDDMRLAQQSMMASEPEDTAAEKDVEYLPIRELKAYDARPQAIEPLASVEARAGEDYLQESDELLHGDPYANPVVFARLPTLMIDPALFPVLGHLDGASPKKEIE